MDPSDLDLAITARGAVLDLVAAVHLDLTGIGARVGQPQVRDLDADPVRLLGQLVARHPRPAGGATLSDALASPPVTPTGQLWREVARHATLARHDWDSADPASRPAADTAWTALHRAAGLAEAVALLDGELAGSANAAGDTAAAADLAAGAWSGLVGVAAAVRTLAERADLPEVEDVSTPARTPMPVRSLDDLPAATERLAHLVVNSASLSPKDVQLIALASSRNANHAASLLHDRLGHPGNPEHLAVVTGLAHHARALAVVVERPRRTETIHRSDPRAVLQAGEIARFLAAAAARSSTRPATPGRDVAALIGYAAAATTVTTALEAAGRRQLDEGRWLVPPGEDSPSALHWVPPAAGAPPPPLLDALVKAADHAHDVLSPTAAATGQGNAAAVALQGSPGAQELTAALHAHRDAAVRPPRPGVRVGASPPAASPARGRQVR